MRPPFPRLRLHVPAGHQNRTLASSAPEKENQCPKTRSSLTSWESHRFKSGGNRYSFDVVLSTFGVMFTPNQEQAASELIRVCRPGGKIGMANWTPDGFIGQLFKTIGKYVPPAPGAKSPALWGSKARLDSLFSSRASVAVKSKNFVFRYRSPEHWVEIFRSYYGPVVTAFAAIDPDAREALESDL